MEEEPLNNDSSFNDNNIDKTNIQQSLCIYCNSIISNIDITIIGPVYFCSLSSCREKQYFKMQQQIIQIKQKINDINNQIPLALIFKQYNYTSKELGQLNWSNKEYKLLLAYNLVYINSFINNEKKMNNTNLINALTLILLYIQYIINENYNDDEEDNNNDCMKIQ